MITLVALRLNRCEDNLQVEPPAPGLLLQHNRRANHRIQSSNSKAIVIRSQLAGAELQISHTSIQPTGTEKSCGEWIGGDGNGEATMNRGGRGNERRGGRLDDDERSWLSNNGQICGNVLCSVELEFKFGHEFEVIEFWF
ncbi:hypothetical protein AKJ16_DCAP02300 [Drosera capensis]